LLLSVFRGDWASPSYEWPHGSESLFSFCVLSILPFLFHIVPYIELNSVPAPFFFSPSHIPRTLAGARSKCFLSSFRPDCLFLSSFFLSHMNNLRPFACLTPRSRGSSDYIPRFPPPIFPFLFSPPLGELKLLSLSGVSRVPFEILLPCSFFSALSDLSEGLSSGPYSYAFPRPRPCLVVFSIVLCVTFVITRYPCPPDPNPTYRPDRLVDFAFVQGSIPALLFGPPASTSPSPIRRLSSSKFRWSPVRLGL